ncbi:unnamed protein product [Miscanthus lutarioriparius]|uniref:Uncharacterized protein n=1 Tax=Miscanthus lutarioriparius TaxID=422564 RepID=A0A811MPK3_9POAL|nr:unnamed protein product [Miscanthus lutarioriparius]
MFSRECLLGGCTDGMVVLCTLLGKRVVLQPWPPPEQFGMQGNGVHLRPTPWPSFSGNTVELYLHKPLTESIRSPWMPPENVAMLHHPQHHDNRNTRTGELKSECFAQLHSVSSAPCPGQEPSKIVAAPPGGHDGTEKKFVALGGKVHRSSPECASAFLCHPFFHSIMHHHHHVGIHTPVGIPHLPDHGHGHSIPPVTKPPAVDVPEHKPAPVPVPEHKPPSTPVGTPPSTPTAPSTTPVYSPPKSTPIYHPPAQRDAVTAP